ncbi:MAG: transporter substrate-binding domain-containing protein [Gammaproteobacteria bacterium]|nr:transporter substrate-binding domain-containing protein [Gammaproteobacteria bacterium]
MLNRFFTLVLAIALCSAAQAEQTLRLMANTSPPYADSKLPEQGLALELVKHVFARTPYQADIGIESWSRSLEGAQIGVYDGLAAVWYSPEREQDLLFSEPYLSSDLVILKRRADQRRYTRLGELAGSRLGVRADYAYGIDFSQVPDLQLVQENHLIQNLLRLQNGSVDFVIGDRRTVNQQLHEFLKDRITDFSVTAIELPRVSRHVAVSRSMANAEQVISAFNAALAQAREDGSHKAIVRKWDERYRGLN